ncbi:hypothetical protein ACGVWS_06815 [Enterobacteriaceae bacterium LUAb1]
MVARRVPAGVRIFTGLAIFVLTFLLMRPSDPATQGQIDFWKKAAGLLGERDVEGFVGIALLIVCTIVTTVGYQVAVRLIEKMLNK